jgi:hypothetical protein
MVDCFFCVKKNRIHEVRIVYNNRNAQKEQIERMQQCAECIGENTLTLCAFSFVGGCNHNADVPGQHKNKNECNSIVVAVAIHMPMQRMTLFRHFDPFLGI